MYRIPPIRFFTKSSTLAPKFPSEKNEAEQEEEEKKEPVFEGKGKGKKKAKEEENGEAVNGTSTENGVSEN